MTLSGFRIKLPVADFGDRGPMICNAEERLTIGRRLPSDSQTRSDLLETKSVAGVIGVQHALRAAPVYCRLLLVGFSPFDLDVYQLQVKNDGNATRMIGRIFTGLPVSKRAHYPAPQHARSGWPKAVNLRSSTCFPLYSQ